MMTFKTSKTYQMNDYVIINSKSKKVVVVLSVVHLKSRRIFRCATSRPRGNANFAKYHSCCTAGRLNGLYIIRHYKILQHRGLPLERFRVRFRDFISLETNMSAETEPHMTDVGGDRNTSYRVEDRCQVARPSPCPTAKRSAAARGISSLVMPQREVPKVTQRLARADQATWSLGRATFFFWFNAVINCRVAPWCLYIACVDT